MQDLTNGNIVHVKNNGVEYIQFKRLLEHKNAVTHCMTLRENDLNFGNLNNSLTRDNLISNYRKICDRLNLEYDNIIRSSQTHTDQIKCVDLAYHVNHEPILAPDYLKNVDGIITDERDATLSLTYADCIPLLFFDPIKNAIANVHSGWQGTLKRIGQKTVSRLVDEYDCNPKDIICCIGPSIRECHFAVDEDVKNLFCNEFHSDKFISFRNEAKYYIDTVAINKMMLQEAGLKSENIIDSGICTVCNVDKCYSYRGDNKGEKRFTAIISLI